MSATGGKNSPEQCRKGTIWIEGFKGLVLHLSLDLIEVSIAYPATRLEAVYSRSKRRTGARAAPGTSVRFPRGL